MDIYDKNNRVIQNKCNTRKRSQKCMDVIKKQYKNEFIYFVL